MYGYSISFQYDCIDRITHQSVYAHDKTLAKCEEARVLGSVMRYCVTAALDK